MFNKGFLGFRVRRGSSEDSWGTEGGTLMRDLGGYLGGYLGGSL